MLQLNITNETSQLKAVVLGIATSNGLIPTLEDCYDPKSREHVLNGTYPKEQDMIEEMEAVAAVFKKYEISVFRPKVIKNYNQIFSRDIAFVIEDKLIKANILPDREKEYIAIANVTNQINPQNIIELPKDCHIEGGDVMPWNEYIFVGTYSGEDYPNFITARTNNKAVLALQQL
ncbi:MAG: amidinotransferase, partial [Flavobacteriaceae bacterium CG17_big_fil_post_rev_8_21_14_2_50_31_13]